MVRSDGWSFQRGDTIIEVLFATAIGGLVIVLAMAVMNRSVATTQAAVEQTMVRQAMDGQAEALRLLRDEKDASGAESTSQSWQAILDRANGNSTAAEFGEASCSPAKPAHDFYLDTAAGSLAGMLKTDPDGSPEGGPEVFATPGHGLWVEPVSTSTRSYVDFHVRACWDPPHSGPKTTLGTIVRIGK